MDPSLVGAIASVGGLGLLLGGGLAYASRVFFVKVDPRIEEVDEALPGANCGACGEAGCRQMAVKVVNGKLTAADCPVASDDIRALVAKIMGAEVETAESKVAVVRCTGSPDKCPDRFDYVGYETCSGADKVGHGHKACDWGCLGFADCVAACPFDAMVMGADRLPKVLDENCTGCGKCVEACPRDIMDLIPRSAEVFIACKNINKTKQVQAVCEVGCIGCARCANKKATPSGQIQMNDDTNLPEFDYSIKDTALAAVHVCPTDSLVDKKAGTRPIWHIDPTKCNGTGACAKACPVKKCITETDGGKYVIDPEMCISCGLCEPVCPSDAISPIQVTAIKMAG